MKMLAKTIVLCAALATGAGAIAQERAMIVFDGSGSMWGQIEGVPKHEIARQALRDVLDSLPDTLELGLMAYGHRDKGSCTDIETLVAPGQNNKEEVLQAVENMKFLGKTPLSEAVRRAAHELRHTEEKATVILITDGEETCQADPCALGLELDSTGIDFTAHVIGFGLTKQQGEQVSCLAENTGGQYFEAGDAANLQQALLSSVQALVAPPQSAPEIEPAVAPEPLPEATVDAPEVAGAGTVIEISWTGPDDRSDYLTVVKPDAKEADYGAYVRTSGGTPSKLQMPDALGPHEIRYVKQEGRKVLARQTIELVAVQASVSGPERAQSGASIEVDWTGPNSPSDYITVVESGAPDDEYNDYARTSGGSPVKLQMPDGLGNYEIRYILQSSKRSLAAQAIVLDPVTATVALQNTAVPGGKLTVAWTGPNNQSDYVTIVPSGAPQEKYLDYARTSSGSPVTITAPSEEGDFEVRYVMASSKRVLASQKITLSDAGASLSAPEMVAAGSAIEVGWTGPGNRQDFIELVAKDSAADAKPLAATRVTQGNPLLVQAPAMPGTYQLRYMMRDTKEVLESVPIVVQ